MLLYEQAQKRLKAFQIKDWEKARLAALGQLPAELKAAGRHLLGRDPDGKPFRHWEKRQKAEEQVLAAMTKMSPRDRQRLFSVLFPRLGGLLEASWQLYATLPYEIDYDRKGFRAPGDPVAHKDARWVWLFQVINALKG